MTRRIETPILIVGGGPIGLTLALDLGWRGVECLLIEQGDGSIDLPRGAMVAARTMEFCRRWGIKDRIVHSGFPSDYKLDMVFCTSLAGHLLERDEYPCERDQPRPLEVAQCSMCGTALPLGLLIADGGQACANIRWYCKDTKSCTERWTSAR